MSNERWLEKFNKWEPEEIKLTNIDNTNLKCKGFEIGINGMCIHYMGCPIVSRTCKEECDVDI